MTHIYADDIEQLRRRCRDLMNMHDDTIQKISKLPTSEIHESDHLFGQATMFLDEACRVLGKKVKLVEQRNLTITTDERLKQYRLDAGEKWDLLVKKFEDWLDNDGPHLKSDDLRLWRESLDRLYVNKDGI